MDSHRKHQRRRSGGFGGLSKGPSAVFATTNNNNASSASSSSVSTQTTTTQTTQMNAMMMMMMSVQDSPFLREKLQKVSEKVASKGQACKTFAETALTKYCEAHEKMARESERFAKAMERLDEEMEEKEQQQHFGGGGKEDALTTFAKKSGVIEEETRTDALVARVRESGEAHGSLARDVRETVGHMLEVFGTHECERQKAKQSVFAKTVEKVERERSKHARSNSNASKIKFSEVTNAMDLARFELMAYLQRGVHESESVVEKVTMEMMKKHLQFYKKLGGNREEEEEMVKEREKALNEFEEEVKKMMEHFRREVDSYSMENGLSREQHDAVAAGVISPVSEGEDAENRPTSPTLLYDGSLTTDRARELSNKLTASLANLELLRSKAAREQQQQSNSQEFSNARSLTTREVQKQPSSSLVDGKSKHNRSKSEGFSIHDASFSSELLSRASHGNEQNIDIEDRILTQGYLWKRSRTLRDWKKRYFVLDVYGNLTYYRSSSNSKAFIQSRLGGVFGGSSHENATNDIDLTEAHETVRLLTSTVKLGTGVEREDDPKNVKHFVANAFRIISMEKTYVLRAESEEAQADWMEAITSAITVLLNQNHHLPTTNLPNDADNTYNNNNNNNNNNEHTLGSITADAMSNSSQTTNTTGHRRTLSGCSALSSDLSDTQIENNPFMNSDKSPTLSLALGNSPLEILRSAPGCSMCADCSMPEPEWASLNYGVALCVECSGAHRRLGVHVSKVRSALLDVQVWTDPLLSGAFVKWGNTNANAVLEAKLLNKSSSLDKDISAMRKPHPKSTKEEKLDFIQKKYAEKLFVDGKRETITSMSHPDAELLKIAAISGDVSEIMRTFTCGARIDSRDVAEKIFKALVMQNFTNAVEVIEILARNGFDLENFRCAQTGRTPLHCAVMCDNDALAKFLVAAKRADVSAKDGDGLTALEAAMQRGYVRDADLLHVLSAAKDE